MSISLCLRFRNNYF